MVEMLEEFGQQQFQALVALQQSVHASDEFAKVAMAVLLANVERAELTDGMIDAVAHTAWQIADAMIAERKKRFGIDDASK